jgi:hypothetical protein
MSNVLYDPCTYTRSVGFPNLDHRFVLDIILDPDRLTVWICSHVSTVWIDRRVCFVCWHMSKIVKLSKNKYYYHSQAPICVFFNTLLNPLLLPIGS